MKATKIFRSGLLTAVLSAFLVGLVMGQGTLKNGGTFRNTGSASFKEVQNYRTAAGTVVNSSTINVNVAGGSGNFLNSSGGLNGIVRNYIGGAGSGTIVTGGTTGNFQNGTGSLDNDSTSGVSVLRIAGNISTGTGTVDSDSGKVEYVGGSGNIFVPTDGYGALVLSANRSIANTDSLRVLDSLRIASGGTFNIGTGKLALRSASNTNAGTATFGSGTVYYFRDAAQTLIPTSYASLILTGSSASHDKSASGGVTVTSLLKVDANDSLDVQSGTLNLSTLAAITNSGGVKVGGTASFADALTDVGTFVYYASTAQTVGGTTYNNLILRNGTAGNTKSFAADTFSVKSNFTFENMDSTGTTFAVASIFSFTGTGSQSVAADDYGKLEFQNAGTKTISGAVRALASLAANDAVNIASSAVVSIAASTGSLSIALGSLTNAGSLVNAGAITLTSGDFNNDGSVTNSGTITVN